MEKRLDVSASEILRAYEAVDPIWAELTAKLPQQYLWPDTVFEQLDQLILDHLGIGQGRYNIARFVRENWNRMDQELPQSVLRTAYDDALPCLTSLAGLGLKMGIVSNIPSEERLRSELEAIRLNHFFSVLIASGTIGVAKPDRLIFETAAKRIGQNPDEILFVGDDPRRDYDGAVHAGMKALLIDRRGVFKGESNVCRISSLEKVSGLLA